MTTRPAPARRRGPTEEMISNANRQKTLRRRQLEDLSKRATPARLTIFLSARQPDWPLRCIPPRLGGVFLLAHVYFVHKALPVETDRSDPA